MTTTNVVDVLVIGGGPGGSTIATLLRRKGWRVVICEKAHHPRFHIGESLLPLNLPLFEQLGVLEQVAEMGVVKYGADFCLDGQIAITESIYFQDALDKHHPYAFQVRRSEFDHLLLENSAAEGVEIYQGMTIKDVIFRSGQTHLAYAEDENSNRHRWEARFVVDASGRDTFIARKLGLKRNNKRHQSAAIFGHFEDVARRPGKDQGNISVYWFKHGWFWMIPLRDGRFSVGSVCWPEYLKTRRTDLATFLWESIRLCPGIYERMRGARLVSEARAAGNYSYSARRMYGEGYLLIGDAFAFVDPVFSSGVYLAMKGAATGAQAIDAELLGSKQAGRLMKQLDTEARRGLEVFSWFICRFTSPVIQRLFTSPRNFFRMKEALISVLSGDVFQNRATRFPLALFKIVYYVTWMMNLRQAWSAYRQRRRNARIEYADNQISPGSV